MEKVKKWIITGWILAGLLLIQFTVDEGEYKKILSAKMESYREANPMEMLYIHTDKDVYSPGDELHFKGYVMDFYSSKPSQSSNILNLILIDHQGRTVLNSLFDMEGNQVAGKLVFTGSMPEGKYTLVGFTDLMHNGKPEHSFQKNLFVTNISFPNTIIHLATPDTFYRPGNNAEVNVSLLLPNGKPYKTSFTYDIKLNENTILTGDGKTDKTGKSSINVKLPDFPDYSLISAEISVKRSGTIGKNCIVIPVTGLPYTVDLFPEGGQLIDGIETKVGFIANDYFGNSTEIEGEVLDLDDNVISRFKSLYKGVGYFTIVPEKNNPAKVRITKPSGINDVFNLPEILSGGANISFLGRSNSNLSFEIINTIIGKEGPFHIAAEQNGKIVWFDSFSVESKVGFTIPISSLSAGVIQITLLDPEGSPLAQRAVYVNKNSSTIQVKTSQNEYLPKEKVKLDLEVYDSEGAVEIADLSVGVSDANIDPDWNEDPDIFSYFTLGPEIEKSPFPPGYFVNPEPVQAQQIDALMLTVQDKKFNWNTMLNDIENARETRVNENYLDGIQDLNRPNNLAAFYARIENIQFFYRHILKYNQIFPEYYLVNKRYLRIKSVNARSGQKERIQEMLSNGVPVLDVVRTIKNFQLMGTNIVFYGPNSLLNQDGALIVLDGVKLGTDAGILKNMNPHEIENIKVITDPSGMLVYTGLNTVGIIEVTSKRGGLAEEESAEENVQYNPTLYWNPFIYTLETRNVSLEFESTVMKSSYNIVVQGVDEKGNPVYATKNFSVF